MKGIEEERKEIIQREIQERKKSETQSKAEQGEEQKSKGIEKERLNGEAEKITPSSYSSLQNQVCSLPFSSLAIKMMNVSL